MYATFASISFAIIEKHGSTTFKLKRSFGMHCNATIQETFPRAILHLLHRYPFIPRILPRCISQRQFLMHSVRVSYQFNRLCRKIRSSYLSFRMLLCEKGISGEPGRRGFNRAPKTIEINISQLFYRISPDSILTASAYPAFCEHL